MSSMLRHHDINRIAQSEVLQPPAGWCCPCLTDSHLGATHKQMSHGVLIWITVVWTLSGVTLVIQCRAFMGTHSPQTDAVS